MYTLLKHILVNARTAVGFPCATRQDFASVSPNHPVTQWPMQWFLTPSDPHSAPKKCEFAICSENWKCFKKLLPKTYVLKMTSLYFSVFRIVTSLSAGDSAGNRVPDCFCSSRISMTSGSSNVTCATNSWPKDDYLGQSFSGWLVLLVMEKAWGMRRERKELQYKDLCQHIVYFCWSNRDSPSSTQHSCLPSHHPKTESGWDSLTPGALVCRLLLTILAT